MHTVRWGINRIPRNVCVCVCPASPYLIHGQTHLADGETGVVAVTRERCACTPCALRSDAALRGVTNAVEVDDTIATAEKQAVAHIEGIAHVVLTVQGGGRTPYKLRHTKA